MKEEKNIIVEIDKNLNPKIFTYENLIHRPEIRRVEKIIEEIRTNSQTIEKEDLDDIRTNLDYYHHTITISGTRGSGKTSFLKNILAQSSTNEKALILPIIDPTLIEEKGHIFLYVVSLIKDQVYYLREENNIHPDKLRNFDEKLRLLAQGLPLLDGINSDITSEHWNDAQYFLSEGLSKVKGATYLTRYFRDYVNYALELLKRDILIIAFDDVDTDFGKGFPVLETIRKYLTAPNIITLLSGDLSLYSLLIRKKQWSNFGKTLLKNEYDSDPNHKNLNEEYPELTIQLESQYTMKVFKPEYRISLSTLANKLNKNVASYSIDDGKLQLEITLYYKQKVLSKLGIYGESVFPTYLEFLLSLPIRTQLSMLKIGKDDAKDIIQIITNTFYSELKACKMEVWDFVNGYGMINAHILKLLLDNNILDEGSQFVPKINKPILDGAVFATGAVFAEKLKTSPFEIFDYMVRVSNVVDKANRWVIEQSEATTKDPTVMEFVDYSRSMYDYGLRKIASLQNAYISSFYKGNELFEMGLIPIYGLNKTTKKEKNPNAIDAIFELDNKPTIYDYIGYFPAMRVVDERGQTNTFYSINNLLGVIGDLLRINRKSDSKETIEKELKNEFIRLGQLRDFAKYRNTNLVFTPDDKNTDIENTVKPIIDFIHNDELNINKFVSEFKIWADKAYKLNPIPPYLIGRIMVRTLFSFGRIVQSENVEDILDSQIRCFLNAVLVEEMMEYFGTDGLRLTNPTSSRDNYFHNQKYFQEKVSSKDQQKYLYDFISSCPLIELFTYSDDYGFTPIFHRVRSLNSEAGILKVLLPSSIKKLVPSRIIYLKDVKMGMPEENGSYSDDKEKYILVKYLHSHSYTKRDALGLSKDVLTDILKQIYKGFRNNWKHDSLLKTLQDQTYMIDRKTEWK